MPGTGQKVCGGGWVVVECEFSVLLWSKPLTFRLKIWTWTKPNNNAKNIIQRVQCKEYNTESRMDTKGCIQYDA